MKELKQYICQQAEISISLHLCNSFKLLHFDCVVFTWTIAIISYNALLHFNVSTVKESLFLEMIYMQHKCEKFVCLHITVLPSP